jgi:LuxR family maltose regulon positive regulatory protein
VEDAPPQLHIVVATRSEPALPLPRLRLQRALLELRGADLAWGLAEASELLNGPLGLSLEPGEVAILLRATRGWVTGLCLAAISLRAHGGGAAAFSGADRYVVDYIASEVLEGQPPAVREFLLRSAGLGELSARACEGLMRAGPQPPADPTPAGAQAMLEHLERHNLFLDPLDTRRTRYRYQPLFAEALRALQARYLPDEAGEPPAREATVGAGERPRLALLVPQMLPGPRVEEPLSDREQQILILTAGGRANREIAEQLSISEGTVKTHLKRIFNKLGARNRTEAVAIARGNQLIPLI